MRGLEGKVVVITGGAGGIGRATAEVLAGAGARGVITDVDTAAGGDVVNELQESTGGDLRFEHLDVSDAAAVGALSEKLESEGWPVHGRMANAVAPGYPATPILDTIQAGSPEVFEEWVSRTPVGRLGTPHEIGDATAFLLSDMAGGITATVLRVDGGYGAR